MIFSDNNLPWIETKRLERSQYFDLRKRAIFECFKWDPQIEDIEVLAPFPIVLKKTEWNKISELAENLSDEILEAEKEIFESAHLHKDIGMPWMIRRVLKKYGHLGVSHGSARVMRFDFHWTTEGWLISEANTDVPGGFNEASGISKLMLKYYPEYKITGDPSEKIVEIIKRKTEEAGIIGGGNNDYSGSVKQANVAFVHATSYSDDRQVMEYLSGLCVEKNLNPIPAAPDHIKWDNGFPYLLNGKNKTNIDFIFRFFPAEWLPNLLFKCDWKYFFCGSKIPISNPASALLIQSKKLPVFWDRLKSPMKTWRKYLPETVAGERIIELNPEEWVLKPIFGRVGDGIGIEGETDEKDMVKIRRNVKKHTKWWIAQRRFKPLPFVQERQEFYPCIGVYTIDGKTAGAYGRLAKKKLIDCRAQESAVFICDE